EVSEAGSTTVNAKVFYEIVRELPDEKISMRLGDGERLEIASGNSQLKIIGVSAEEYPSLPGLGLAVKSDLAAEQLSEMISKTVYAVSADETRFNLSGVCFELIKAESGEQLLRMVATDGHRLAMITRPAESLNFQGSALVPRKGLNEVRKLLEDEKGKVGIEVKEGFLLLQGSRAKVSMRLIDGEFPDYKQVLPKDEGVVAVVSTDEISQALRRVSLVVTDKAKGVRLDFSKGTLRVSSSSPELGEASEQVKVDYDGKPLSVGFNAKYLIDVAASFQEKTNLCMELHGELGPGKFFAQNDESYVAIVMPMRL
ncbi:MAG: DNA polymerase III subunit beta, partial [Bdellovibrionales bacterium]|nr:DNA polymerase III subunit beta [Bdellovibrionales bacterium]